MSFVKATSLSESGDTLTAEISRDWEIWGPNGGYLSAIALRAAGLRAPAGHRPASISVQYLSRAEFGAAEVSVTLRREARAAACFAVSMRQSDKAILDAQIWTTNKPESEGPDYSEIAMPDVPAPETLPLFHNPHFPF